MQLKEKIGKIKTQFESSFHGLGLVSNKWAKEHFVGLFAFNLILILLVLLHSAGYFHPFLPLTINIIVMIALILGVVLLGMRSRAVFVISFLFLTFAFFLLVVRVHIWSERTMIYVFQAYVLGVILLFFENVKVPKKTE